MFTFAGMHHGIAMAERWSSEFARTEVAHSSSQHVIHPMDEAWAQEFQHKGQWNISYTGHCIY